MEEQLILKTLSSLEKIFPNSQIDSPIQNPIDHSKGLPTASSGSMLANEVYRFSAALWIDAPNYGVVPVKFSIESPLADAVRVQQIGLIPSELPCYEANDGRYLRTEPGLYPDVLLGVEDAELSIVPGRWEGLWITVQGENLSPGTYPIQLSAQLTDGTVQAEVTYTLRIIAQRLPEQRLIFTQWLHADCIAEYHRVPVFSEEFWELLERYVSMAAEHGINMILTPVITPPLDTQVGGERPTVQLVDITEDSKGYSFEFSKLERWISVCEGCGIRYFEMAHLFTQWGAKHAPKIIVNGEKHFGWETDSGSPDYGRFLSSFLKALTAFLEQKQLSDRCFFHVSDEPNADDLESYRQAHNIVTREIGDLPIIDALSNYSFYANGVAKEPVVAINHIVPFLENKVSKLWAYYCCSQYHKVSNRFFSMPSYRNRVLGIQLYRFGIKGFLHWGYNFYNTRYSRKSIDPYAVSDAGRSFPSGDAFSVYPVPGGCTASLRLAVFHDALQDLRALELLESLTSRPEVLSFIEEHYAPLLSFDEYPEGANPLLEFRHIVNQRIEELS